MAEPARRVVLVGFMGAGKSTIGPLLAKRLGFRFVDMDRQIEARDGRKVATIFREDGEEAFRRLERDEAERLGGEARLVVAAGGGAFTRPETRALLQQDAVSVWLRCDLDTALGRVSGDGSRPLAGNRDIMRALLAEREPLYRMADVAVDAVGTPEDVANRVAALVRRRLRAETAAER